MHHNIFLARISEIWFSWNINGLTHTCESFPAWNAVIFFLLHHSQWWNITAKNLKPQPLNEEKLSAVPLLFLNGQLFSVQKSRYVTVCAANICTSMIFLVMPMCFWVYSLACCRVNIVNNLFDTVYYINLKFET